MGQRTSFPAPNLFQSFSFFSFKRDSPRRRSFHRPTLVRPGMFTTPTSRTNICAPLISSCIAAASARTQEYLHFQDPEDRFHPSPQVFLMTCISRSASLDMTETFTCTVMTPEQRVLLGADWVWTALQPPALTPRTQIAVRVLHLPGREEAAEAAAATRACSEAVRMAQAESSHKNMCERMVDFCTSVGKDCYALFLFFGRKDDRKNIYGVLSNNFEAAIGKCEKIDRDLIENFFKGLRCFQTTSGMMEAVVTRRTDEPLTLMIRFT
ncbi:rab15 effector protein isoform X2 [Cololabis saira]|uniref:rab15 effector protein isoform X2 n=1 Tax=Cololabis saira TaxID=129043 RepID=UPI002AD56184|nr:rab15 effector protein isoform X2 [Cololabis saira]